jgi:hypothetical protein
MLRSAKAIGAGIAVPFSEIVIWVLVGPLKIEIPTEIQTAIQAVIVGAVAWLVPNKRAR